MVNIRDHLGSLEQTEDELFDRARYLLRSAFIRARMLEPLRQGSTEIGKNIMIIGGSEMGLSCALNLDMQGFRVRLIHRARVEGGPEPPKSIRKRPIDPSIGRNITHIKEAEIETIDGHVGDFRIALTADGVRHRWQADAVCLTDDHVAPLAIQEDILGLKKLYRYNFAFFHTPQLGIYRVMPRTLERVSAFEAGAALAAQVATATAEAFLKDHQLSPRVDPERCRGCERCADICPFDAIKMVPSHGGIYTAEVVRHNCVGCGGCVGRCPVTAMDIPYFSNQLITEILVNTLAGEQ
jgi:heterodisulfide reductase subunit A-like polyferredoxin